MSRLAYRMVEAATVERQLPPSPSITYVDEVLADAPAMYLRLEESSGTVANDSSVAGTNDGTYTNATGYVLGEPGIVGGGSAVNLLGPSPNGYISVPDAASLTMGDVFSFECWFTRNTTTTNHPGVFATKGTNSYYVAFDGVTGAIRLAKSGTGTNICVSTITILDQIPHHLVVTKNGAAVKIWIDGVDRSGTVTNATILSTSILLSVGCNYNGGTIANAMNAVIDEVALYPTVLSAARIAVHYAEGPAAPPVPVPGVVWTGNFDTVNTTQYYQLLTPTQGNRVSFSTAVRFGATGSSCKMELAPGDTSGTNATYPNSTSSDGLCRNQYRGWGYGNHYGNPNEDRYFKFAVYIDPAMTIGGSFSNPWRACVAWPSVQDGAFSPLKYFIARELNGSAQPTGVDSIYVGGDLGGTVANDPTAWRLPNVVKGQWYEFVTRIKFSGDAAVGKWEFWMRRAWLGETLYTKQTFNAGTLNGTQTANIRTLSATTATANMRVGLYRNKSFTTTDTLYYDDVRMGTTFASVGD